MWFKKYWPAMLGLALQAESIWKFIKWALDWRGRYDALAATYHEAGGVSAVIGFILDPPPWVYPLAFITGLVLIWWNFWRVRHSQREAVNETKQPPEQVEIKAEKPPILPKPLKELFESDFPRLGKKMHPMPVTFDGLPTIDCMMFVYQDFDSGVEFVSFYIPKCERPVDVCDYFANNFRRDYDQLRAQIQFNIRSPGETVMDRSIDLPLSGRVYLYHEDEMGYQDFARVTGIFKMFGLVPRFRGPNYKMDEWKKRLLAQVS
jgi:hypothetical protein